MPNQLLEVLNSAGRGLESLADIADRASDFIQQSKASNTVRAYRSDWAHFVAWCKNHSDSALPATPTTVALYVADLADTHRPGTLSRRLSAISQAHQIRELESPTASAKVRLVMAGIRRNKGTAQRVKKPVLVDDLRNMIACLPTGLLGSRNRALLSIGFCGAFRRSELVGLDVTDTSLVREGLVVTIRRSKTDQEGEGRKIGIPNATDRSLCPIGALQAWLELSGIVHGPLFRPSIGMAECATAGYHRRLWRMS